MPNECLYRLIRSQLANMNLLICTATGKGSVCLPIDIECGSIVEGELLMRLSSNSIPNDCCLVNTSRKNIISFLVPFKRKNGAFMLTECICKTTFCCPYTSITIITASCKVCSITLKKIIN